MTAAVVRGQPGSSPTAILNNDSQGLATSGIIKATPAVFLEVNGVNNSGSTRYFQLFNSATVPADTATPFCVPVPVPANSAFSMRFESGLFLSTGLVWASSSTLATKTITLVADMWVTVTYK